jgi:hypothetical protein
MQALEGDIDTSHLAYLHLGAIRPDEATPKSFNYYTVADRAPRYHVIDTDIGTMYGAYRPAEDDTYLPLCSIPFSVLHHDSDQHSRCAGGRPRMGAIG